MIVFWMLIFWSKAEISFSNGTSPFGHRCSTEAPLKYTFNGQYEEVIPTASSNLSRQMSPQKGIKNSTTFQNDLPGHMR